MMFQTINKQLLLVTIKKGLLCFLLFFIFSCKNDDDTAPPMPPTGDSVSEI